MPDGTELGFSVLKTELVDGLSEAMSERYISLIQGAGAELDADPTMTIATVLGQVWAEALHTLAQGADNPPEWMQEVAAVVLLRLETAAVMAMGFRCPACGSRMPDDLRTRVINRELQFMCPACNAWGSRLHRVPGDPAAVVKELRELTSPQTQASVDAEDDVA